MTRLRAIARLACATAIGSGALTALAGTTFAQRVPIGNPGSIIGFIGDSAGAPIAFAEIMIPGLPKALSDSMGNFVIRAIPPGRVLISIRRIGFSPEALVATVSPGVTITVPVVMRPLARTLPAVRVDGQADSRQMPDYHGIHKFDLFYQRRATSLGGTFFTRSQIEQRMPARLSDLLEGKLARLPRCRNALLSVSGTDAYSSSYRLFIDNLPYNIQDSPIDALDAIPPWAVEGLEIYTSPSQLPMEAMGNACAAIFIWMHSVDGDSLS